MEKVIVGEINEKEEKDPYKLTFVYKTGISNKIEAKKQERLKLGKSMKDNVKKLCSHVRDEVEELYSSCVADTCGDYCDDTKEKLVEVLYFRHFAKHFVFTLEGEKIRNEHLKNYFDVSVVVDIGCGNTNEK